MSLGQSLRRLLPAALTPETVQSVLKTNDPAPQLELACRSDAPAEALYYLASSADPAIRQAVAANEATPLQANRMLAQDESEQIRAELSRKIGRLAPGLTTSERLRVREQAITILEALAADQAPRVRALLAEEIARCTGVPKSIIRALAEDSELAVCGPILEYSPLLSDVDLRELIEASRVSGAVSCIARRDTVSGDVSAAIAASGDVAAVAALLGNANAQIREDTLDAILDGAPSVIDWHEPLVMRASLSIRAMRRNAGSVAADLVTRMVSHHQLDEAVARDLLKVVRQRIESQPVAEEDTQDAETQAATAVVHGHFGDSWVLENAQAGRRVLVTAALGLAAGIGIAAARKMVAARDGKAVLALAWKAQLAPRTGYELQQLVGHLQGGELVMLRNGADYPQSAAQMGWIVDTFAD